MSDSSSNANSIGVGMGGSCPECRSPVDLGQEFCLECGAPVRVVRKTSRGGKQATPAAAHAALPGGRRGFPWIPFLAVLGLVTIGVVFAFVDSGSKKPASTSSTGTTGVTDLDNTYATSDTLPTVDTSTTDCTPTTASTSSIPTVPQVGVSTSPTPTTNSTDCVDTTTNATTPTLTDASSTATTASTSGTTSTSSGDTWPAGTSGYTVVIASYAKNVYSRNDAELRAVEAQQQGLTAGVLDSDDYASLTANLWVVFSGRYDSFDAANAALPKVQQAGYQGAYVREVSAS